MTEPGATPSVFLVGTRWFGVLGPCREMIAALCDAGYRVVVLGQRDNHYRRYDRGLAELVELRMRRSYVSPLSDILDVIHIVRLARHYKPVVIHSFNPKPSLVAFVAARLCGIRHFFIGVTGLGNTFIRAKLMRPLITLGLRRAADHARFVFFQNDDDVQLFRDRRIGTPDKYRRFVGPGVDLKEFDASRRVRAEDARPVKFVCVARLIWQKGIREYVEAARRVKQSDPLGFEFLLVGEFDDEHPDCVERSFIDHAVRDGIIQRISWTDDLAEVLAECDVNVLCSYREGAPRAILEASAMGLPTIGTDAIGVRELVVDGGTGILVPLRDIDSVYEAMIRLGRDSALRRVLGDAAVRRIAEPLSLVAASRAQLEMYRAIGVNLTS